MISVLGDVSQIDRALLWEKCKIFTCTPELNQKGSRQHHRPHHLWEDDGWRKAGKSTDSLGAAWSWACTSTCAMLTAMQSSYTTCDKTRSTDKFHHHHLTKLSRDHQRQPLYLKCTKEQSVGHRTNATTTAPEALCKLLQKGGHFKK